MLLVCTLSISVAWASDTESLSSDEWSFPVSPYVWGISLEGNAPIFGMNIYTLI